MASTEARPASAGGMEPQRRTFVNPTTEGDQRNLFLQNSLCLMSHRLRHEDHLLI